MYYILILQSSTCIKNEIEGFATKLTSARPNNKGNCTWMLESLWLFEQPEQGFSISLVVGAIFLTIVWIHYHIVWFSI